MNDSDTIRTRCCIAGGGPAGIMTAYLLARAGVDVVVLEKYPDFFRDFRGDTIHPSTLRIMDDLGLLDEFLKIPHSEARELSARFGQTVLPVADFSHIPGRCKFIALMPQWDFLNFLAERGRAFPAFRLLLNAEATGLLRDGERVTGISAKVEGRPRNIFADLVIAADGRHSTIRASAGLESQNLGSPMDVLWMRISRRPSDPDQVFGSLAPGGFLVTIDRGDYFQCALVIRKGGYDDVHARGLEALQADVARLAPFLADRTGELKSWDQIKLLSVTVDRLARWYEPGLLCIGDAAHAMSPVGGVGINLAIQDAVAAANALAEPLRNGPVATALLAGVQRRRETAVKVTQAVQVFVQNRVVAPTLAARGPISPPPILRLLAAVPWLRRIPAYAVGIGLRPERVQTPQAGS